EPGELSAPALTTASLVVPPSAVRFQAVGHRWKSAVETAIVGEVILRRAGEQAADLVTAFGTAIPVRGREYSQLVRVPERSTSIQIAIDIAGGSSDAKSPISVGWFSADGRELLPPAEDRKSTRL